MPTIKFLNPLNITIYLLFLGLMPLHAQNLHGKALADSLLAEVPKMKSDTAQAKLLNKAVAPVLSTDPLSAMQYAERAMQLSQRNGWGKGIGQAYMSKARIYAATSDFATSLEKADSAYEIFKSIQWKAAMGDALAIIANDYERLGNYAKAVENNFKALSIYEEAGAQINIAWEYNNIGVDYYQVNDYQKAIENYNKALVLQRKLNDKNGIASALDNMASVYKDEGEFEKANEMNLEALKLFEEINDEPALGRIYINRGSFMEMQNNFDSAMMFYKKAIGIARKLDIKRTLAFGYGGIGNLYFTIAKNGTGKYITPDSLKLGKTMLLKKAYDYYSTALQLSERGDELYLMMQYAHTLSETEALRGNYKDALKLYQRSAEYKDSIYNDENKTKIATLENQRIAEVKDKEIQLLNKEKALRISEQQKKDADSKQVKNIQFFTIAVLCLIVLAVMVIALLQYRHNKQRQKANASLQQQKEKLEITLKELRSTQSQLIQSAKMASLGELTAGIAHEIQNPLNFVNNFSELSNELLDEMISEWNKNNRENAMALADDAKQNLAKIVYHGKRADAIVKGMLQHSRTSTGAKELTDINALADEFLRLSYHGFRAKDKGFHATMKTDFDNAVGKINIVSQDIGRVLLNLYNNAFYAVSEKKKSAETSYEPTVSVSTKKIDNTITISVKDNGDGIPQIVVDKIFQPFFTTKPTGQGTGLGLSLSYDIVNAHGGNITMNTSEGKFTIFLVELPIS